MSATERLIALLERQRPGDPAVREVVQALRRFPQQLAVRFDHYQRLIGTVGVEQATAIVIDNTIQVGGRWRTAR
jgi:hypothetical protein